MNFHVSARYVIAILPLIILGIGSRAVAEEMAGQAKNRGASEWMSRIDALNFSATATAKEQAVRFFFIVARIRTLAQT